MSEQVNHPAHYQKNGRECIDVMIEKFGVWAVINFCECNQFKYEWRAGLKEGNSAEQDLAKAKWYENKAKELRDDNRRDTSTSGQTKTWVAGDENPGRVC